MSNPLTCCSSLTYAKIAAAMAAEEKALFGINKLNVARSEIPAVTHVDYSARLQTVHTETNPRFHSLLSRFKQGPAARSSSIRASMCVASRSFARRRTPSAAYGHRIDLVTGDCFLSKAEQILLFG